MQLPNTQLTTLKRLLINVSHRRPFCIMQVEVTSERSIVTIELQCSKGYADIYARIGGIPTTSSFCARAIATDENGKVARITLEVEKPRNIGILILSRSTGASYRIWAFQTGSSVGGLPPIEKASALISTFNVVSQNTLDDLSLRLPRLLANAHDHVSGYEINTRFNREEKPNRYLPRLSTPSIDNVTENVAFKKGRRVIKEQIRSGAHEAHDDPNVDPDLMRMRFNPQSPDSQYGGLNGLVAEEMKTPCHTDSNNQYSFDKNMRNSWITPVVVRPVKYELRLSSKESSKKKTTK
jgi:hypothetical protein